MTTQATGNPPGRPAALTPEVQARIVELMSAGNFLATAASEVGIHRSTLYSWLARGRTERARLEALDPDQPDPEPDTAAREARYVAFLDATDQAEARGEAFAVTAWMGRIKAGDWRAAATFLARRHPDAWAPRSSVRVTDDESAARIEAAVEAALRDPSIGLPREDDAAGEDDGEDMSDTA